MPDYDAVRYDLATDATDLPDSELDDVYARAEAKYGVATDATEAYVRLMVVRRLKVEAAKRVDYKQNQSSESLSDLFEHLKALETQFKQELEDALESSKGSIRFGGLKRYIPRYQAYPENYPFVSLDNTDVSRLDD